MTNFYSFFKFLHDKKGKPIPFEIKLIYAPETISKKDLQVEGYLDLSNTKITTLPDNLQVGGNLILSNTKITTLPDNLKVEGVLDLSNTPLSKKYTEEQIRKMIEDKGGSVRKGSLKI